MNRNISRIEYDNPWKEPTFWWTQAGSVSPAAYVITQWSQTDTEQYQALVKRLTELRSLEDNWDGYRGAGISSAAVDEASALVKAQISSGGKLNLPEVFPTPNGTIAMEWQQGEGEAVFEIGNAGISGFVKPQPSAPTYYINRASFGGSYLPLIIASLMAPQIPWAGSYLTVKYDGTADD
jgi:hypothetical protein